MINNIRISELPVLTSPSLSGVTTITFGNTTYQTSLQNLLNVLNNAVSISDITYYDLFNCVTGGTLVPGTMYRLLDYQSVNFLNGYSSATNTVTPTIPNHNPKEIYTGDTEVLLLSAISSTDLSPIGLSETYPTDIVHYQPIENTIGVPVEVYNGDSNGTTNFDLKWNGSNVYINIPTGFTLSYGNNLYIYADFSGATYNIESSIDILFPGIDQYMDYEYSTPIGRIRVTDNGTRLFLLDLTFNDYSNYDTSSLYLEFVSSVGDALGRIYRRIDTFANVDVPFDFRGQKFRRFEVDLTSINSNLGVGYYSSGENIKNLWSVTAYTGNYDDFPVFVEGYPQNIHWNSTIYDKFVHDNNVFFGNVFDISFNNCTYVYDNTFGDYFVKSLINNCDFNNNVFYEGSYNNKISDQFVENLIGDSFQGNTSILSFQKNNITNLCLFNDMGGNFNNNTIQYDFQFNKIGFGFQENVIDNTFRDNVINNVFYNNIISYNFSSNYIRDGFQSNNIGGIFIDNFIDIGFEENEIGNSCISNKIGSDFQNNIIGNNFIKNNIGTDFYLNTISNNFEENKIGNHFQENGISEDFQDNSIGNNFSENDISDNFKDNVINNYFQGNLISTQFTDNKIGNYFVDNTIDDNFYSNSFGNNINNNEISFSFNNNVILNDFFENIIGNDFFNNQIDNDFHSNNISSGFTQNIVLGKSICNKNFQPATHVYNQYTCTLFNRQDGTPKLSYYNNSDSLVVVNIDS